MKQEDPPGGLLADAVGWAVVVACVVGMLCAAAALAALAGV